LLVGYLIFEQLYLYSQAEKKNRWENLTEYLCIFYVITFSCWIYGPCCL